MKRVSKYVWMALIALLIVGCDEQKGPEEKGEIRLSSESFGTTSYYLIGYHFEESEFYRYPTEGGQIPDIINEGYRVLGEGGGFITLPGFNTPAQMNGFALVGEFESLDGARSYYEAYEEVEDGLQFETISDTVRLFQVWVQKTSSDKYVKLLVKDIQDYEGNSGNLFNDVLLEFTYQSDGSATFPN